MAFRFSLAAVLKYREELEKREELALELRREVVARLKANLAEAEGKRLRLQAERELLLERGALGDDLIYATEQEERVKIIQEELRRNISAAMLDYQNQMKVFLAARQKREILNELRNAKKESYCVQQERREQQNTDEIFIARLNRDI
jgi:flagellar biosynthesis chaperone FliJ